MNWDVVIGLEVHVQLNTCSKLFSGAATTYGASPNTQVSFVDVGLPGVLPVLNQEAVRMAIQFGLAIKAQIAPLTFFERKNYFYPDLPKGYQISQLQSPIVTDGTLDILLGSGQTKTISIARAHLEEDAGKSIHLSRYTGLDFNRAGMPLLEIVTTPCLTSGEEVVCYLKTLHQLVRFLGICEGNLEEGAFRTDVNLSLKPKGSLTLGTRTELKNLNSFRFIEKAITYEIDRHQEILEQRQPIVQETRLYNPNTDSTYAMRSKEQENDYRYFPDPDLLPLAISTEEIVALQKTLPPLPAAIRQQLGLDSSITLEDQEFLLSSPALYHYFSAVRQITTAPIKLLINWLKGSYKALLPAADLAHLLNHLHEQTLTMQQARMIFKSLLEGGNLVELVQSAKNDSTHPEALAQLDNLVRQIVAEHPQQALEYRAGKDKLLAFFVGKIMKQTQGKADPTIVHTLLKKYLG